MARRRELARADRVLPGLWRLRLPLPWPGVPHGNAYAIAAGDGVVLVDTGLHEPGSMRQLELALDQAGLRVEHVRLVVCTHAHSDHYGQAAPIMERTGAELWMHPNHEHMTKAAEDPERAFERRFEIARQSGVPADALAAYKEARGAQKFGIAEIVMPDRDLVPGVEVETDLGNWQVYETPGHAPSHVVLHQPERELLLSGDHLLGRVSLYYDFGYSPDPAGEFLSSLDVVDELDVQLVLAGHGRPVRDARALTEANRRAIAERFERIRRSLADGPRTAFDIVPEMLDVELPAPMMIGWGLSEALCYLRHMELPVRWSAWTARTLSVAAGRRLSAVRDRALDRGLRPRPGVRCAQRGQDRPRCRRAVQGVEVHSGRASRQEIGALEGRVSDPELCNRFRVVGAPVELPFEVLGDRRAAHVGEAVDLAVVRDRHDPRHDRHVDARGARLVDVVEVDLVVEEELGDQEARARLDLLPRVAKVARAVRGVEVHLGEARGADAEVEALADQPDQLHRVGEPARVRLPRGLAARRVAAQGEHVLDAGGLDLLEELHEPLARLADARQVRHRLDAEVAA